jgi:hypothetical protein
LIKTNNKSSCVNYPTQLEIGEVQDYLSETSSLLTELETTVAVLKEFM